MAHVSELIAEDIEQYLKAHEHKSLLRFITCGSVDDGKSTLIGRLLFDSKMLFEDQMEALEADSKKDGTQGGELDFALLVDGLAAEREQGITIDVAYRFFSTGRRKFIVADTPGHEQYTRNMVTGASTADVAVVMIDARRGVLTQSRRHSFLASLIGIRKVVLAVNKMDLMDYSEKVFNSIVDDYRAFARQIDLQDFTAIPMSALRGDNITEKSEHMPWYRGTTLMGLSNQEGHLVLATGNKSELAVGYSTLYGDAVGGYAPIKDLLKSEVWAIARWRNKVAQLRGEILPIPENSISKEPSAELRPDQLDTDSLPPYDQLDQLLTIYIENDGGLQGLLDAGFDEALATRVIQMVDRAEYKRRQYPPGPKISRRAFGKDRRLPITSSWREQI